MPPVRRNIFLIDKKFQFRFAFYVCTWLFALSFIYPLIVDSLFGYFIRFASLDPNGPSILQLQRTRTEIFWLLVATQVIFLAMAFLISLFMAHRIAGPLYKLRQHFAKARDGVLGEKLFFRKSDYFQEVAADYNVMMASVLARLGKGAGAPSAGGTQEAIRHIELVLPSTEGAARAELEAALTALRSGGGSK